MLTIGLGSAIINFFVARQMRKSNEKNIMTEFKATLGTKNRQDWIDDVRHNLSEYLSKCEIMKFHMDDGPRAVVKYFEQITYIMSKLRLLLNDDDEIQHLLLTCINDYYLSLFNEKSDLYGKESQYRDMLIQYARQLFTIHWDKIKKLEL